MAVTQLNQGALSQLSAFRPLFNDLVTETAAPNRFVKPGYSGDIDAITNRLNQYQAYDTSKLGGLADYFAPKAALSVGNQLLFKPEEFNALSSNLNSLDAERVKALQPILGDLSQIGEVGGQKFFDKTALENQLAKYTALGADDYSKYSVLPEVQRLNPLAEANGMKFFDKDALSNIMNKYQTLDTTKLPQNVFGNKLGSLAYDLGGQKVLSSDTLNYYQNLADQLAGTRIDYYGLNNLADQYKDVQYDPTEVFSNTPAIGLNVDGNKMYYLPYESMARLGYNKEKDQLQHISELLGNEDVFKSGIGYILPENLKQTIRDQLAAREGTNWIGSDFQYDRPDVGYLMSKEDFYKNVMDKFGPGLTAAQHDPGYTWNSGHGNIAKASDMANAWLMRNSDVDLSNLPAGVGAAMEAPGKYEWVAQGPNPKQIYGWDTDAGVGDVKAWDQWTEIKKKGGFGGALSSFMNAVSPILAFTPLAPIAAGWQLGTGLVNGNPLQVVGGALGAAGALGAFGQGGLSGQLGSKAADLVGTSINAASPLAQSIGGGLLGVGGGLLSGQSPLAALKSGLASGVGNYAGSLAGGALGDLGKYGQNLGAGMTSGAVNSLIRGGNIGQGALYGGLGGLTNALGNTISSGLRQQGLAPFAASMVGATPGAMAQYLMNQNRQRQQLQQLAASRRRT